MHIAALERRADGGAQYAVFVSLRGCVEARVEIFGRLNRRENANVAREQPVHCFLEIRRGDRIFQGERGDLSQRVNTGVGAARSGDVHRLAFDSRDDFFEDALDGRKAGLDLPAVEIGSVVGERDADASGHSVSDQAGRDQAGRDPGFMTGRPA